MVRAPGEMAQSEEGGKKALRGTAPIARGLGICQSGGILGTSLPSLASASPYTGRGMD